MKPTATDIKLWAGLASSLTDATAVSTLNERFNELVRMGVIEDVDHAVTGIGRR